MLDIIIPVYNRAHTICATLDSILASTYKDYKIALVNDASTDNLLSVIQNYPISIINREQNSGSPGKCCNTGIEATQGSHITIIDSDDTITPDALRILMSEFKNNYDLVYSNRINLYDNDVWVQHCGSSIPYSQENMLKANCISQLCIYAKELYNKVGGFSPEFNRSEDYELYIKMSKIAKVKHVTKNLYFCNRKSTHNSIILNEPETVLKYMKLAQDKHKVFVPLSHSL